jgi:hypothetical protein
MLEVAVEVAVVVEVERSRGKRSLAFANLLVRLAEEKGTGERANGRTGEGGEGAKGRARRRGRGRPPGGRARGKGKSDEPSR